MKDIIKRGSIVRVISGAHRGREGKILQLLPKKNRAIVEGVAMIKKHTKKSQDQPEGAIVEKEGSIHISNLMLLSRYQAKHNKQPASAES